MNKKIIVETIERKIINLTHEGEDYNSFVESFTIGELLEMYDETNFTPYECGLYEDYGNCIVSNAAGIIYNYISSQLTELIKDRAVGEDAELASAYTKALAILNP